jgi:hypothetical protein
MVPLLALMTSYTYLEANHRRIRRKESQSFLGVDCRHQSTNVLGGLLKLIEKLKRNLSVDTARNCALSLE